MAAEAWEQPLPLGLQPAPGESLAGYLLCLADRLMCTPGETAARVGLVGRPGLAVPTSYAVDLPPAARGRFSRATGLTGPEIDGMLLSGWDGRLFEPRDDADRTVNTAGRYWAWEDRTRACPACAAENARSGDGPVWHLNWRTGWSFACTRHGTYLSDACPRCGVLVGDGPGHGLLRRAADKIPVDACRACRHPAGAGSAIAEPAAGAALDAQRELDALFRPPTGAPAGGTSSLHVPVDPAQCLRDLRLLAVVLDASRTVPADLPPDLAAALNEHADAHRDLDRAPGTGRAAPRARSAPPATAVHNAAVLTTVVRALALAPGDADTLLAPVVAGARRHDPLLLNRARWTFGGSAPVQALLRDPVRNTFTSPALRSSVRPDRHDEAALEPRTVPAFLPAADYSTRFGWVGPEPTVRRAVPVLAARLLTGGSLQDAADLLGVQHGSAQMAQTRLARAVRGPGEAYRLRDAVAELVHDWAADTSRPDLAHRRGCLLDWQITEGDWDALVAPLREREAGRGGKRVPWAALRRPGSILLWALVTAGEPAQAPLADTGTTSQVTVLRKGGVSGLRELLDAQATDLAQTLDATAPGRAAATA